MPDHRQPMGRPATLVLMVPVGCVIGTAGDWHLIGTEDGRVLKAINRFTNESMPVQQLAALAVPPEEFAKSQAIEVGGCAPPIMVDAVPVEALGREG